MITEASFQVCVIDGRSIEESPVYDTLLREHGREFADRWTEELTVRMKPPDGGEANDPVGTNVVGHRPLEGLDTFRRSRVPCEKISHTGSRAAASSE